MPNQKIFCNVPWTNLHIYWDGSFGACCSEEGKPYSIGSYNLKELTVKKWFNSEPMQSLRQNIVKDKKLSICGNCYAEENIGHESRRIKENFKSGIFTELAFDESFVQSPMHNVFLQHDTTIVPIDWHIDLGNECNLACKMCFPNTSSKIAVQYKKWNLLPQGQNIFNSWTDDEDSFKNFLTSIKETPNLNRVHFMGGEPLLNKKFTDILDALFLYTPNVSISFVTNGTIYNSEIIKKLKRFSSCDIEISLESFDRTNNYIRQGSEVELIKNNLEYFLSHSSKNFNIILRSVPQLLNINSYHNYLRNCLDKGIPVQSIPLKSPKYLQVSVLPKNIRDIILIEYEKLELELKQTQTKEINWISTGRDKSRIVTSLLRETKAMIALLKQENKDENLCYELVHWLKKWDQVYKFNALEYYPIYADFFKQYGYID